MAATSHRSTFTEESAEVEVLYANLEKMKSLTKKIQGSMGRLESSGRTVQEAIGPIYGNTQRLQTTNANVDRVLEAIERIREPLDKRNREERIIRSRPDRVGLGEYIGSIDRTNQALRELKTTNIRSNQQAIGELNSLLKEGTRNLEQVFRDVVRRESQPIEPLRFITKNSPFPRLAAGNSDQLRTINTHIHNAFGAQQVKGEMMSPAAKAYCDERGQYITLSLQNLTTASVNTARKANANEAYKKESNAIGSYMKAMEGMFIAEYDNICNIFSRGEWAVVLNATCAGSLQAFASTLQELDTHIKANMVTDCYLSYEILEVVSQTSFQIEQRTGELKQAMEDATRPIRQTAKSTLPLLLQDTRSRVQQLQQLPLDGGVVPVVPDIMKRLQHMTEYLKPLSSVLRSLGDGGWLSASGGTSSTSLPTLKSFDVGADGNLLFSHYARDTINMLLEALEAKGRGGLKSQSLQGVFMANNIAIIERMVRQSDLQPIASSAVQPKLMEWKKKATKMYTNGWIDVAGHLRDQVVTSRQQRPPSLGQGIESAQVVKSLSSKEKDTIKEKWREFNVTFDELVAKHKGYKMETEVRGQLGRDVQAFIDPLYSRFWDRYHEIDKGKGKYVKYDKAQMNALLTSLAG
ncbi:hypothetical protein K431DRAFT_221006 [Polychaeton citri CBS 116435]|uniref:Exocyst complex protein EXO70 n=1 Tax=Polychaeton citri CBS 116435 TaxID=1314669 RepID=A0A9P4UQI7_9PEZI|nr:hypothetical protein K431DRAFT_221006 [Polychaeton citri CBS 116435]